MATLARLVIARRWWVIGAWIVLVIAGGFGASRATANLSFDFGLPGQAGYETNEQIVHSVGNGGDNAPILMVLQADSRKLTSADAQRVTGAVQAASPGVRLTSYA